MLNKLLLTGQTFRIKLNSDLTIVVKDDKIIDAIVHGQSVGTEYLEEVYALCRAKWLGEKKLPESELFSGYSQYHVWNNRNYLVDSFERLIAWLRVAAIRHAKINGLIIFPSGANCPAGSQDGKIISQLLTSGRGVPVVPNWSGIVTDGNDWRAWQCFSFDRACNIYYKGNPLGRKITTANVRIFEEYAGTQICAELDEIMRREMADKVVHACDAGNLHVVGYELLKPVQKIELQATIIAKMVELIRESR